MVIHRTACGYTLCIDALTNKLTVLVEGLCKLCVLLADVIRKIITLRCKNLLNCVQTLYYIVLCSRLFTGSCVKTRSKFTDGLSKLLCGYWCIGCSPTSLFINLTRYIVNVPAGVVTADW